MPKKKTRKAAAKRFRKTSKGRLKHAKAGRSHLQSSKSRKRKRALRHAGVLSPPEEKRIKNLLAS
ncbi:MAG: 50S ribosomal protein L35 [Kiritimatiellae bacterium]|nr:50S ribosomal protein L35 [Kiritimatiellia bacterium]